MSFFDEIKTYVRFGATDVVALARLQPLLEPRFVEFADHFYHVIVHHPRASSAITGGPAQVARLKQTLVAWMDSGLSGPHDEDYYQRRSRIGRIHVQIGLAQEFMFTAMNVLRLDFHAAINELPGLVGIDLRHSHDAIDKLFDLELAIMLRHYQRDSEAKVVQRERTTLADRLAAMQTLSAGLAHEVRNPLNAATLQLELLERRIRREHGGERLLEPTALVHHELERLTLLLNDFLNFARPTQLAAGEHDLVELAGNIVELVRPSAQARGVEVTLHTTADRVMAWLDATRMHQVILNLVKNAIEAVSSGGHVELRVATVAGGGALVTVTDDGPGIPAEVLARMYEPFFSTKEGGTGLGMAIVHSLVELHGGALDVATSEAGSEVTVRLPPRPGGAAAPPAPPPAAVDPRDGG